MSASLVPFDFHGDRLDVIPQNGDAFVVLKRVCDVLGVDDEAQRQKLRNDPSATTLMIKAVADDGKERAMLCLSLDSLPLWLATIHPSKVRPEVREKLIRYKRECARVLADHFLGRRGAPSVASVQADTIHALLGEGDIRDNDLFRREFFGYIAGIARAQKTSWQRAHGELRRAFRVVSYLAIRLALYQTAKDWLQAKLANPTCSPPMLIAKPSRQLTLFGKAA